MTTPAFEAFLARIYTDEIIRAAFLRNPIETARNAGLSEPECQALAAIDRKGLQMAADSFAAKRRKKHSPTR